jgi:hypothetical protein
MMQCPSCGGLQQEGILCSDCCAAFETMLAAVPELVDQLNVAVSKQARVGSGVGGKGGLARERSPINWGAVAVRDALLVEVVLWGDDINAVRRHPDAGKIVARFGRVVKDAYRVIDRMQERQYLGTCLYEEDGATCHAELWARIDAAHVKCSQCEQVHPVAERRAWLLAKAEPIVVTVREAARYLADMGSIEVSEKTIRTWVTRRQVLLRPGLSDQRQFELGELLKVLARKRVEQQERDNVAA